MLPTGRALPEPDLTQPAIKVPFQVVLTPSSRPTGSCSNFYVFKCAPTLLRLVPLRRHDRYSFLGEFSLISPGTRNRGQVRVALAVPLRRSPAATPARTRSPLLWFSPAGPATPAAPSQRKVAPADVTQVLTDLGGQARYGNSASRS